MAEAYRIQMAPRVAGQLQLIFDRIALHSTENAADFIAQLLAAIEGLKTFPKRQKIHRHSTSGQSVRQLPYGEYMIYFEVNEASSTVFILRVTHGARRRPMRL